MFGFHQLCSVEINEERWTTRIRIWIWIRIRIRIGIRPDQCCFCLLSPVSCVRFGLCAVWFWSVDSFLIAFVEDLVDCSLHRANACRCRWQMADGRYKYKCRYTHTSRALGLKIDADEKEWVVAPRFWFGKVPVAINVQLILKSVIHLCASSSTLPASQFDWIRPSCTLAIRSQKLKAKGQKRKNWQWKPTKYTWKSRDDVGKNIGDILLISRSVMKRRYLYLSLSLGFFFFNFVFRSPPRWLRPSKSQKKESPPRFSRMSRGRDSRAKLIFSQ